MPRSASPTGLEDFDPSPSSSLGEASPSSPRRGVDGINVNNELVAADASVRSASSSRLRPLLGCFAGGAEVDMPSPTTPRRRDAGEAQTPRGRAAAAAPLPPSPRPLPPTSVGSSWGALNVPQTILAGLTEVRSRG